MDFAREAARNVACPARRPLAIDSDLLLLLAISLAIAGDLLLLLAISLAIAGDLLLLLAISWLRLPEGASPSGLWGPQRPDRLRNGAWGCAAAGETLRNGACPHESCFLNARL